MDKDFDFTGLEKMSKQVSMPAKVTDSARAKRANSLNFMAFDFDCVNSKAISSNLS